MPKLIVQSQRDGYRRAGIAFSRDGIEIDTADLKKDQLAAIESDSNLKVQPIAPVKKDGGKA
ncbi:MAG: hypothetical protein JSR92_19965 [Proteobacteria bacterium]|nr:hypothetical protein [Pseudomonadota bacterium]